MDEETINEKYIRYLDEIISELTDESSFRDAQEKDLDDMFNKFSFDNPQIGEVKAKTNIAQTQYLNQYATQGAIELIREEKKQELIDAQIRQTEAEIDQIEAKIELIGAQKDQAIKQTELIEAQKALIERQDAGYDDNLIVKAGEFQGGLASFAVNANSDSAQDAIDNFNDTIDEIKSRAHS